MVNNLRLFQPFRIYQQFLIHIFFPVKNEDHVLNSLAVKWWKMRLLWVQQELFDEKSEVIFKSAKELCANVNINCLNDEGQIHFHLEIASFNLNYFDIALIQKEIGIAADLAGISVHETGALGKRTKFQEQEIAQLTLNVENSKIVEENQDNGAKGQ